MKKGHLIELLEKLSPKEIKEFGDYVCSPFFNKNQSVIKLYEYLRKHYPDFEFDKIQKQYVHGVIFPHAPYNDGFMRTIIFNLMQLAEDYLAYRYYKSTPFIEKRNLLYELNERKLDRQIEKDLKPIFNELDRISVRDGDYYYNRFNIEYEYFYFLNRLNFDKEHKLINNTGIEHMFDHLTYYYLLHAIKLYIYIINAKALYQINFKTELLEDIIKNLKPQLYLESPIFNLYYNVLMLHLNPDDVSYFYKVKDLVQENEKQINEYQLVDTYINLENYCKNKIRNGQENFNNELFKIIGLELEKKSYAVQGMMSAKYYVTSVEIGLKLRNYEWTKRFIEKYKSELPKDKRENTYLYTLSLLEFSKKNFEISLEYLSKVKYNEIYHNAEVRCLMTSLYYELNYIESLLAHLDTFRHFLTNDKTLPDERKKYYSNFLVYSKRLYNVKSKSDTDGAALLYKKISEESILYNKEWLVSKAKELIK